MIMLFAFSINLKVEKGGLIAIVGQVGCGKSSLLSTLLGEMEKLHGNVTVNVSILFCLSKLLPPRKEAT